MNPAEAHVRSEIQRSGPLAAFRQLIAENDALIRGAGLDNGREITSARTAIHTALVADWAAEQQQASGYAKPFAIVALGGTGRGEMTPCSDNDFAFLFDEALDGNAFLLELQRQVLHSDTFEQRCGFACHPLPFCLDDMPGLAGEQLNSFLDMRPVYDPQGLAEQFRERIQRTFDSFEHFLHVRGFWKDQWEKAAGESERLDCFDIKNDGLRVFLAGIWTLAGKRFVHSHDVYRMQEDPRDLAAYDFLLRIRSFVHLRRPRGRHNTARRNHPEDVLRFDDFVSFGELLGPEADERAKFDFASTVRARLLAARRRVAQFAKGVIERELKVGRAVSPGHPVVYGVGGLAHTTAHKCQTPRDRSHAALSLLLASQQYGVPIDPYEVLTTFAGTGDWLERVPELSALFYEQRGSLADSFAFLSQLPGAEERLFPGYARFEVSIDDRVRTERQSLRSVLERQKMRALEQMVRAGREKLANAVSSAPGSDLTSVTAEVEAALLDTEHLAAVKLALKTKRLPLTDEDLVARHNTSLPLDQRYTGGFSEIPLREYYASYAEQCDFPAETLRITEFLVAHRRTYKERCLEGLNDDTKVAEFAQLCQNEKLLRALFVFTCADRAEWESEQADPSRWFNTRELYSKTLMHFRPRSDLAKILRGAGFSAEELDILKDFGPDFFSGVYRQYANRFGGHLLRVVEEPGCTGAKANLLCDGKSVILGVAARDYRGLAATISGALWRRGFEPHQAHLFSARHHGLALDFFHLAPGEQPPAPDLARAVEEAIARQLHIAADDEAELPRVNGKASLHEWRPGLCCLRFETSEAANGLIYTLTFKVFRYLRGNIFGLTAHAVRGAAFVSVYHSLPPDLTLQQAQAITAQQF